MPVNLYRCAGLWALCLFARPAHAEVDFRVTRVSPHVYALRPERLARVNSTSTVIVGSSYLVVVEAQPDRGQARRLVQTLRAKVSKLPIRYLVYTHAHLDHVLGAGAFAEDSPGVSIIAHEWTRERVLANGEADRKGMMDFVRQRAEGPDAVASEVSELRQYLRDLESSPILAPTLTLRDSLVLHDAGLRVDILSLGEGHTPGDLVVRIPGDGVVVTGDLVHDLEPLFWDADPDAWMATLNRLEQLPFQSLIGGHGDPQPGKSVLHRWQAYLQSLTALVKEQVATGADERTAVAAITPRLMAQLRGDGYADRIQKSRDGLMMTSFIGDLEGAIRGNVENVWRIYKARDTSAGKAPVPRT